MPARPPSRPPREERARSWPNARAGVGEEEENKRSGPRSSARLEHGIEFRFFIRLVSLTAPGRRHSGRQTSAPLTARRDHGAHGREPAASGRNHKPEIAVQSAASQPRDRMINAAKPRAAAISGGRGPCEAEIEAPCEPGKRRRRTGRRCGDTIEPAAIIAEIAVSRTAVSKAAGRKTARPTTTIDLRNRKRDPAAGSGGAERALAIAGGAMLVPTSAKSGPRIQTRAAPADIQAGGDDAVGRQ